MNIKTITLTNEELKELQLMCKERANGLMSNINQDIQQWNDSIINLDKCVKLEYFLKNYILMIQCIESLTNKD